jgi:hypothetical protein
VIQPPGPGMLASHVAFPTLHLQELKRPGAVSIDTSRAYPGGGFAAAGGSLGLQVQVRAETVIALRSRCCDLLAATHPANLEFLAQLFAKCVLQVRLRYQRKIQRAFSCHMLLQMLPPSPTQTAMLSTPCHIPTSARPATCPECTYTPLTPACCTLLHHA